MTTQLIKYDAACRALAECKAIDEVKAWADKAAAMQAYGRMAKDKTLEVDAAEIRIRAERRLGEMIVAQKAEGGLSKGSRGQLAGKTADGLAVVADDRQKTAPKLADAGISKDLSSRAQKLAAVPEAEFEAEVGQWRERVTAEGERVTSRLQQAGERAQAAAAEPPLTEAGNDEPDEAELAALARAEQDEREAMQRLLDSDDKLATVHAENKQLRQETRVLKERVNGLLNESAEQIRIIKALRGKLAKLEQPA